MTLSYTVCRYAPGDIVATDAGWCINDRNDAAIAASMLGTTLGNNLLVLAVDATGMELFVLSKVGPVWVNNDRHLRGTT